jgi:hypothetical protein
MEARLRITGTPSTEQVQEADAFAEKAAAGIAREWSPLFLSIALGLGLIASDTAVQLRSALVARPTPSVSALTQSREIGVNDHPVVRSGGAQR